MDNSERRKWPEAVRRPITSTTPALVEARAPAYLTPRQVAARLQISPKTLYRLTALDATLPATRIGRAVRFRADLLEKWLERRTQRSRRMIGDQRGQATTPGTSTAA